LVDGSSGETPARRTMSEAELHLIRAFDLTNRRIDRFPARQAGAVLAALEVALGLASLSEVASRTVDIGVLMATIVFVTTAAIGMRYRPGVRCRCFGALADTPLDRHALIRNVGLLVAAATVVIASPADKPVRSFFAILMVGGGGAFALSCAQAARALDTLRTPAHNHER
jgi:hypothetical protein